MSLSLFTQPSNHSGGGKGQIPQTPIITSYMCWTVTTMDVPQVTRSIQLQPLNKRWYLEKSSPTKSHEPTQSVGSIFSPCVFRSPSHPEQRPEQVPVVYLVPTFVHWLAFLLITQTAKLGATHIIHIIAMNNILGYICANVQNSNKHQMPIPIVLFPTEDKSQMLVGVSGFFCPVWKGLFIHQVSRNTVQLMSLSIYWML